jgi:hypothetical protein
MKLENLSFRDRFDILLEKRPSGIAELRYKMLYGKSQIKVFLRVINRKRQISNMWEILFVEYLALDGIRIAKIAKKIR